MNQEMKRRRLRKLYWYMGGDHLVNVCDCHDCRKRKKRILKSPLPRREKRELVRIKEEGKSSDTLE